MAQACVILPYDSRLVLTMENTGKRPIEILKLQATVTDGDADVIPAGHSSITRHFGDKLPPGQITAVSSIHAALLPGERRAVEASIYLHETSPEDIGEYQLEVLEIE